MSFKTLDDARAIQTNRTLVIPSLCAGLGRGGTFLLSTPYSRNGAGTPTFSSFGVQEDTQFNTEWTFTFPAGTPPSVTAMFGGTLVLATVSGSGIRATITTFDAPLVMYMRMELPRWLDPPSTVVYEFLEATSVTTAITALVAVMPMEQVTAKLKTAAAVNATLYTATGDETADRGRLVAAVTAGVDTALYVNPGAVLGDAANVSTNPTLIVKCPLDTTTFLDPAFYVRQLAPVCKNLADHEDAAMFTEHRGVLAGCGTVLTLADAPTGTLYELLSLAEAEDPFTTIVLEVDELVDSTRENASDEWVTAFDDESLVVVSFPVNIVGRDCTPMLNRSAFTDEDSPLDYALEHDPGEAGQSPITTTIPGEVTAQADWSSSIDTTPVASGGMPVIQGGRVHADPDTVEATLTAQQSAFRCMKVDITDPTMAAMSIANIAFYKGGVRASTGLGMLGADRSPRGGGGLLIDGCSRVYVRNCIFSENRSVTGGGGAVGGDEITDQNEFRGTGAGACVFGGSPLFDGCLFEANRGFHGGGLALQDGSFANVRHCVFVNNLAAKGGGLCVFGLSIAGAYGDYPASAIGLILTGGRLNQLVADAAGFVAECAQFPANGPVVVWRCLMDGNEVYDNGGNLYLTAWAMVLMQASVLRYGNAGMSTWRGIELDADAREGTGGGNVRVTFASDLVVAGGGIYNGHTESTDLEGGGGISTRNADIALISDLDDLTSFPEFRDNDSMEFAGGGIYFASKWDLRVDFSFEVFWIIQCTYNMLELYPDDAASALVDAGFLLFAYAASGGDITTAATSAFQTWYNAYKTKFNMGTAHLVIDPGCSIFDCSANSNTEAVTGGAIQVSRLTAGQGSDPAQTPLYSFVDADEWMCQLSIELSIGVQFLGNSTNETTPATTMLGLTDTVAEPDVTKTDSDLTQTAGVLTTAFSYVTT